MRFLCGYYAFHGLDTIEHDNWSHSSLLYQLVLDLYDVCKSTLISSNQSPESLVRKVVVPKDRKAVPTAAGGEVMVLFGSDGVMQERALDRLAEMCVFIDFSDTQSFRADMQRGYIEGLGKKQV